MKLDNGALHRYQVITEQMRALAKEKEILDTALKKCGSFSTRDFDVKVGFQTMTCPRPIAHIGDVLGMSQGELLEKGVLQTVRFKKVSVKKKRPAKKARGKKT